MPSCESGHGIARPDPVVHRNIFNLSGGVEKSVVALDRPKSSVKSAQNRRISSSRKCCDQASNLGDGILSSEGEGMDCIEFVLFPLHSR
jgi:hypothetical protein